MATFFVLFFAAETFSQLSGEPLKGAFVLADLITMLISVLHSLKGAVFVTLVGGLFPQIAITEYRVLNSVLTGRNNRSTGENTTKTTKKSYLRRTMRLLGVFRRRHTANTYFLLHYNRKIVSDCCAAYFTCNLPSNVYILLYLFFVGNQTDKLYLFLLATFACQTFIPLISIFNFIAANEAISSSVPHLLKTAQRVSQAKSTLGCLFAESWKTAAYIELLHRSSGQLELRAGQLGAFRRENVLQVFILLFLTNKKLFNLFKQKKFNCSLSASTPLLSCTFTATLSSSL